MIISFSTIPPRFSELHAISRVLLSQTVKADEIRLYVPRRYRRFPEYDGSAPHVPAGISIHMIDDDFGPATKVLPAVRDLAGTGTEILFCDDDQLYDNRWAERFLAARRNHPDACIAQRGYDLETRLKGHEFYPVRDGTPRARRRSKNWLYRLRRGLSLGRWKPSPYETPGAVDIIEGFGGGLIRPEFFPGQVFEIPEIIWSVDDPWLSGHLTRNKVPIWVTGDGPTWPVHAPSHKARPLGRAVIDGHDRLAADTACIQYFRETYGIWPDRAPPGRFVSQRVRGAVSA